MKKLLAFITIATMLSIAPSAMAGGGKVPKNLCLDLNMLSQDHQNLVFKSAGKMTVGSSTYKTYTVTGIAFTSTGFGPISGSAYANADSTVIHASYTGKFTGAHLLGFYELLYETLTGNGHINYRYVLSNDTSSTGTDTFDVIDCNTFGQ